MTFVINQNETLEALLRRIEKIERERREELTPIIAHPTLGPNWGSVEEPIIAKVGNTIFLYGRIGATAEVLAGGVILTIPEGFRPTIGAIMDQRGFGPGRNAEYFFTFNSGTGVWTASTNYAVATQIFLGAYGPFYLTP